jgi:hypothetical protein
MNDQHERLSVALRCSFLAQEPSQAHAMYHERKGNRRQNHKGEHGLLWFFALFSLFFVLEYAVSASLLNVYQSDWRSNQHQHKRLILDRMYIIIILYS